MTRQRDLLTLPVTYGFRAWSPCATLTSTQPETSCTGLTAEKRCMLVTVVPVLRVSNDTCARA